MKTPSSLSWSVCAFLILTGAFSYSQQHPRARVAAEVEKITSGIADGPRLKLPPAAAGHTHPESVKTAGQDYVNAWTIWHRVSHPHPQPETAPPRDPPPKLVNAYRERERFHDLLERTIAADPPVDPAEYSRFTYSSLDWCGDEAMTFSRDHSLGYTLALLKSGKTLHALRNLSASPGPSLDNLLKAYGIDPEEFAIGRWLGRRSLPDQICRGGGEKTARMVLHWVETHWRAEVERRQETSYKMPPGEPFFPRLDIMQFLRDGNGVTDATKEKIVRFIRTDGLQIHSTARWIASSPRGSEKWMADLAQVGLTDKLNETKTKSSKILKEAGIDHQPPELLPPPVFKIFVNGEHKPELKVGFSIKHADKTGGLATDTTPTPDGHSTVNPDHLFAFGDNPSLHLHSFPSSWHKPLSPLSPWLFTSVPYPPKFGEITDIHFRTTRVTIKLRFPSSHPPGENDISVIEFEPYEPHRKEIGGSYQYHVKGSAPLVLDQVSPGDYWFRVRHPRTALMSPVKISVSEENNEFEAELRHGASVVIPIKWKVSEFPDHSPHYAVHTILAAHHYGHYTNLLRLWSDGAKLDRRFPAPLPSGASKTFPRSAIYAGLPPGSYEVRLSDTVMDSIRLNDLLSIKPDKIHFTIDHDSPAFVVTDPVEISRKNP